MTIRTEDGDVHLDGIFSVGASSEDAVVGGTLFVNTQSYDPDPAIDPGTLLFTYTLPANTLAVNGQSIWVEWLCSIFSTVTSPNILLKFGSQNWLSQSIFSPTGDTGFYIVARLFRTGTNTQKAYWNWVTSEGDSAYWITNYTTLTQDLSTNINIEAYLDPSSVSENLRSEGFIVGFSGANS